MLNRLALRAVNTKEGVKMAAAAAARHRILSVDVDASGVSAPPASLMLQSLAGAGVDIGGRDVTACAAAEAALALL